MSKQWGARRLIVMGGIAVSLGLAGCAQPGAVAPAAVTAPTASAVASSAPASPATVERLLRAMDMERTLNATFDQVGQIAESMALQAGVRPRDREAFNRYMQRVNAVVREEASWAQLREPMVQIYAKHYTEAEVQGLIAFYESPLGRSMVAKTPAVMQDSAAVTQAMMQRVMPRLAALAQELRAPTPR